MAKPANGKARRGGKKNRKYGRNKTWCERYRKEGRRERNKIRRLGRRLKAHPGDVAAKAAVRRLRGGASISHDVR